MERVCFLVSYNLYETKRHFTEGLAAALRRQGVHVSIVDTGNTTLGKEHVDQILATRPDLTCSFNAVLPLEGGAYLWDFLKIPHLSLLVDPAIYSMDLVRSPYSLVSCVDHFDCELFVNAGFKNVFFLAHAVEQRLFESELPEKKYDAVFIGSGYDPDVCLRRWERDYPSEVQRALKQAAEKTLSDGETTFTQATANACRSEQVKDVNFVQLCREVDTYTRALDRLELIRALDNVDIHVFGGTGWQDDEEEAGSWEGLLKGSSHVTVHPAVSFPEAIEILRASRVCLNSMPFFKQGTHERVFLGLACGCLSVTSANSYWDVHFDEGDGVMQYLHGQWAPLKQWVKHLIDHEDERVKLIERGRKLTLLEHTWDVRAREMLDAIPPMLESIASDHYIRHF